MEFAEVREYEPGDEVRTIDWNVTARMGAPFVKKFVEERDLTLLLVVDVSGSQQFGSQLPAEARLRGRARRRAGVLGRRQPRPRRRRAVLRPHRGLRPAGARTRPRAAHRARPARHASRSGVGRISPWRLRFAQRVLRRRGIVAVISDFQAEGWEKAIGALRRRHDVVALHLADPREGERARGGARGLQRPGDRRARRRRHRATRGAPGAARPGLRRGAGRVQEDARRRAWRSRPASRYDRPLQGFFKARERRR